MERNILSHEEPRRETIPLPITQQPLEERYRDYPEEVLQTLRDYYLGKLVEK
tara:strand:+ start:681 stop:836 length:156 start_codon:yes stop_codon:yes gene_type:complete